MNPIVPWDIKPIEEVLDNYPGLCDHNGGTVAILNEHGIYLLGDCLHYTELNILAIPRVGISRVRKINRALLRQGRVLPLTGRFDPSPIEVDRRARQIRREGIYSSNVYRYSGRTASHGGINHLARLELMREKMREHARRSPWCYSTMNYPVYTHNERQAL